MHEIEQFRLVRAAYAEVQPRLGVAEDLGTLTTPESRNLVRKVRLVDGTVAVLKIVGDAGDCSGEGAVLNAWHRRGLPCVEPITWGTRRTYSFLMTRYVQGSVLRIPPETQAQTVRDLVAWLRPFQSIPTPAGSGRRWDSRLHPHLRETLPLIRKHGLREPADWNGKLRCLSRYGDAVTHGDVTGSNIIVNDRDLILLDPGPFVALREADAGQLCWNVGGERSSGAMVHAVCTADATLNADAVAAFVGFNLIVWAGYALANHVHPMREVSGTNEEERITQAQDYLTRAGTLMRDFRRI